MKTIIRSQKAFCTYKKSGWMQTAHTSTRPVCELTATFVREKQKATILKVIKIELSFREAFNIRKTLQATDIIK